VSSPGAISAIGENLGSEIPLWQSHVVQIQKH